MMSGSWTEMCSLPIILTRFFEDFIPKKFCKNEKVWKNLYKKARTSIRAEKKLLQRYRPQ
jgi:hypothetical protein